MLYGVTVRSPAARGTIRGIRFAGDLPWNEFTVVTAADIPGKNVVTLIVEDQPFLAATAVNHPEEAVVLLAHPDRWLLEEARRHVKIDIDPLPAVFSIADSEAARTVVWGADNVMKSYHVEKGRVDDVWREAAWVVEAEYETGAQEHLYIEPQGMLAQASPAAGVTVWGSLQCPYYVHKALYPLFGLPPDKVRVVQAVTGGGFGGKEEYPSLIAGHAALLAWKSGRPVKLIYDRAEDMVATTKRHPSRTRHKTALARDGRLLGMEIDFVVDGGAYVTLTPVVLSRGTIHAAGPYRCDHVRIHSRALATNAPPHGAFRGFGAPQSIFALERHMDRCARVAGLDPVEFRRRNLLREGETTATQQTIAEKIDLGGLLDLALEKADWRGRKAAFAAHNANPANPVKRGIGLATFFHGAGFTGSGEAWLASVVGAEAAADGRVTVLAASTEIGQGANTVFTQIAADALGLPDDWIEIAQPDTARVPNSGPTVASRTTMIVGKLVEEAVLEVRKKLREAGHLGATYDAAGWAAACARYHAGGGGPVSGMAQYHLPPHVKWDDKTYTGAAYGAFGWAAYVAAVSVDTVTYEARVDDFVAVQDIGKVINPTLAAGQVEGGVAQAIGFALYEQVVWKDGRMANGRMTNYIMPTAADLPPIRTFFPEVPYAYGPAGAKGVGELPMDGPAPAILNAIEDAVGIAVDRIPALPETLFEALAPAGGAASAPSGGRPGPSPTPP
ncbi:MAG: xanthine dehydrogenase family protein [Planctomycetes bacterium]|nr:xanthine dehydrogenase family protein [Planctomycetota bacterium]